METREDRTREFERKTADAIRKCADHLRDHADELARGTRSSKRQCQERCGWAMLWIDQNRFCDRIINMEHYAEQV